MISVPVLRHLISNKIKDARILARHNRCPAAVYIAGYAVELALKYRICRTFQFDNGFPENRQDLQHYVTERNSSNYQLLSIRIEDIRNHDLNRLLSHSGVETQVRNTCVAEWEIISCWHPENRYKKIRMLKISANRYLKAAAKIIREID